MQKKKKEHSFDMEQNHSGKTDFLLKDMELVQIKQPKPEAQRQSYF